MTELTLRARLAAALQRLRHKRRESKLREQLLESRFAESVLDNIPTMVFAKDARDLRFLLFNRAGEQLLGLPRSELIGKSDHDLFPAEQADFFIQKDREVLAQGDIVDIPEEEIDTRNGRRILHTRKVPVRDRSGRPLMLLGISMDVTEQIEDERHILALNEELKRHSQLLESSNQELESFCYSVSHDLRAPLRAINGYSKLLQQNHARNLNDEGLRYLQTIGNASERMARLIDDLLEFSRLGRQSLTINDVDMRQLVANALGDVLDQRGAPRPAIEVGELLPTRGDRTMLLRVWMNLLDNAVKYSAATSQPTIVIASKRQDAEVIYSVTDNGIGFDMNYYEQLFGVFQRLHSAGEYPGTGVGLAVVQRILARHGGRAWAHSTPGQGATFFFALPGGDASPASQSVAS